MYENGIRHGLQIRAIGDSTLFLITSDENSYSLIVSNLHSQSLYGSNFRYLLSFFSQLLFRSVYEMEHSKIY